MKKLFLLFAFLGAALWATAQPYTISIDGIVLTPGGDPAENVEIHIATDSMPTGGPFYFNTIYTDVNGIFSDSFSWNGNWGTAYVTMVNCPGLPSETIYLPWQGGNQGFTLAFVYCDTITSNCTATIQADSSGNGTLLTAIAFGEAPFAYQWNTGEITASITADSTGWYCVTITDNTGCEAEACYYVEDPQNCFVGIQEDPAGSLTAWSQGVPPFTYEWDNGANTQTIFPNTSGYYCVSVTDATGCVATDCYWYQSGSGTDSCYVDIIPQQIPGTTGYNLYASANGEAPFIYLWSTNETTADIDVMESGTYCVTVADAAGCTATECITIQILSASDVIAGYVFPGDSLVPTPLMEGMVYLIEYDPAGGTLTAVDSTDFTITPNGFGFYSFGSVQAGDYLVKAFLNEDSEGYEDYLPTYHFSYLFWDEADEVEIPYMGNPNFNIMLIPGDNPGGPGFIGGLVSQGANFKAGDEVEDECDPMANVSILLLNEQEEPVAHASTHADGSFGFENLAWGTYKVVVEIPGMEQGEKWVTIGPDNPSVNISFGVGENGIVLSVKDLLQPIESLVYPNPAREQLSLYFFLEESARAQLTFTTLDGRIERVQALELHGGGQVLPVYISDLPSGMYILQVTTDTWMVSHRVVKE